MYKHHIADLRVLNKMIQDAGIKTYLIDKQNHQRAFKETTMRFVVDCSIDKLYEVLRDNNIKYEWQATHAGYCYARVIGPKKGSDIYIDILSGCDADLLREELLIALKENWAVPLFLALKDNGLLKILFPELHDCIGIEGGSYHNEEVFDHLINSLIAAHEYKPLLKLAVLLHDIGKPATYKVSKDDQGKPTTSFHNHEIIGATIAYNFCKRLEMKQEDLNYITKMIRHHMFKFPENAKNKTIRRWLYKIGPGWFDLFLLRAADRKGNCAKQRKPSITMEMHRLKAKIEGIITNSEAVFKEDLKISKKLSEAIIGTPQMDMIYTNLIGLVNKEPSRNTAEWIEEYIGKTYGIN